MNGQSDEQNVQTEQNTNVNSPQQTQNQNGEQNTNINSPPQQTQTQNDGFPGFTGIFFPIFGGRPRSSPDDNNSQQEVPGEAQIQFFIYPLPGTQGDGQTTPGVFFFVPQQEVRKLRASESAINGLPIIAITEELVDSQASCPICLEPFPLSIGQERNKKTGQNVLPVRQMPCNHMFCESCLFQWLRQNNSCPLCRKEIEAEEAEAQQNDNNNDATPLFGVMNIVNSPPPSQTTNTVQSNTNSHNSHPHNSQNSRS